MTRTTFPMRQSDWISSQPYMFQSSTMSAYQLQLDNKRQQYGMASSCHLLPLYHLTHSAQCTLSPHTLRRPHTSYRSPTSCHFPCTHPALSSLPQLCHSNRCSCRTALLAAPSSIPARYITLCHSTSHSNSRWDSLLLPCLPYMATFFR